MSLASSSSHGKEKNTLIPIDVARKKRKIYGVSKSKFLGVGRFANRFGMFTQVIETDEQPPARSIATNEDNEGIFYGSTDNPGELDADEIKAIVAAKKALAAEKRAKKKERQWTTWTEDIIPELLQPFVALLQETDNLRNMDHTRAPQRCPGCEKGRDLEICCIYFERIEKRTFCTCTGIPNQLMTLGLFPCAPKQPSVAIDLNMLEFVRELFVNAAPNTTAWCDTLECFLGARKYKLTTRNSLRGRFTNAMHWYSTLVDYKNAQLRGYLNDVRRVLLSVDGQEAGEDRDVQMGERGEDNGNEMEEDNAASEAPLDRPSEYLRERCPLCFGGENWKRRTELVDAIVCLDACFTQKRRKNQGNAWIPPRTHPETVFVPPETAASMEEMVENARPPRRPKPRRSQQQQQPDEDTPDFEDGMRIPTAVLDECNDSFIAADSNRVKASTEFFADTGLMALLCRHDRVLWLVNMTSAGEKQHYALCLLDQLFGHIPPSMRIGVLYDIGCQLHRSCRKFQFLPHALNRIVFGISVFHAYGHQWPCQLVYHPRKCAGFGLTDGEGCERFWSAIKLLIPSLRVSGYYNRIYTLDNQIKHLDGKSLLEMGNWVRRKWAKMEKKKEDVRVILAEVEKKGYSRQHLQDQWAAQVKEQTKPLKRQSKELANKEIREIIALANALDNLKVEAEEYRQLLANGSEDWSVVDLERFLAEALESVKQTQLLIVKKKKKLSVHGQLAVRKLLDNSFLRSRMNALALKQRIRDRLRQRKFELSNLERAYRKNLNNQKLDKHSQTQIKRKEPGIQTLARKYNDLCRTLEKMISRKEAPRGAVAPPLIDMERLWYLDVDDIIWQDVGLTDEIDGLDDVPDWLGNEDVRKGINALLELERCQEERVRLKEECVSMQQWMREEWAVVLLALDNCQGDPPLHYLISERQRYLVRLCIVWNKALESVPVEFSEGWGPSDKELVEGLDFEVEEQVSQMLDEDDGDEDDDDNEESFEMAEAAEMWDQVEDIAFGEQYRELY